MTDATYVVETIPLSGSTGILIRQCASFYNAPIVDHLTDQTGLFVWRGAQFFLKVLEELSLALGPSTSLSQYCTGVFELGGGIGVGALAAAALFSDVDCVVTDFYPPVLHLAKAQIALNKALFERNQSRVSVAQFDWKSIFVDADGDAVGVASDLSQECPWTVLTRSTLLRFTSATSRCALDEARSRLPGRWIIGLDVIYPDTRDDVLVALFATVREILLVRRREMDGPSVEGGCQHHWGGVFSEFVTSFCERDTGLTLRRIVLTASLLGLCITPLVSPFASESTSFDVVTPPQRVAREMLTSITCNDATLWEEAQWSAFHRNVLHAMDTDALGLKVCGTGVWVLCIALDPAIAGTAATPGAVGCNSCLALFSSKPAEVVGHLQRSSNSKWLHYLPWLWQTPLNDTTTTFSSAYRAAVAVKRVKGRLGEFPEDQPNPEAAVGCSQKSVGTVLADKEVWYAIDQIVEADDADVVATSADSSLLDLLPALNLDDD